MVRVYILYTYIYYMHLKYCAVYEHGMDYVPYQHTGHVKAVLVQYIT